MTAPAPVPLLFGFRGIRMLQTIIASTALVMAIAGTFVVKSYLDTDRPLMLILGIVFAVLFIWLFGMAIRLPTSFVAISADRMRIRFGGFVDQTVETRDVLGSSLVKWPIWKGLGVRTSFGGEVGLIGASGVAAEVTLRYPLRVWIIPRLWRVRATRVTLGVRNPHKMVERFGPVKADPARGVGGSKKKRR